MRSKKQNRNKKSPDSDGGRRTYYSMNPKKKNRNNFTHKNKFRRTNKKTHKLRANYFNKQKDQRNKLNVSCGPGASRKNKKFTCLSDNHLLQLRDLWNKRHPDVKLYTSNPKKIWTLLNSHLASTCGRETCWLKQKFVEGKLDHLFKTVYAPVAPKTWHKNKNEWLTSTNILDVMKQYEDPNLYPCFEFMGPSPIDYDKQISHGECVWPELCNFSLEEQIKRGKTKIGIIFNTDPHDKDGEHWISMFINIKKKYIYFYDSVGTGMPENTKNFIDMVVEQGKNLKPPIHFEVGENRGIEHQKGNTECGMYSINFIINMLKDTLSPDDLREKRITDEEMTSSREVYFNKSLD